MLGSQVQHILHVGHEVGAHLRDAPLFLLPRFKGVFFRCRRTASWDNDSTTPNSTIRSASSRRFQWSWPSGAGLQAKAIRWASAPLVQLPVPASLGPVLQRPLQPILGEAPLHAKHRALGHVQGLGHPGCRPALAGLEQGMVVRSRLSGPES